MSKTISIISFFILINFGFLKSQTVYITEEGKKYHAKSCKYVNSKTKTLALKKAKEEGYQPCPLCKAETIKVIEDAELKENKKKK